MAGNLAFGMNIVCSIAHWLFYYSVLVKMGELLFRLWLCCDSLGSVTGDINPVAQFENRHVWRHKKYSAMVIQYLFNAYDGN